MASTPLKPEDVSHIVIHCSATPAKQNIGAKEITRWHREQGWLTIGYHFVIRRDGTVEKGRDVSQIGAHAAGWNHRSLGICLVGGLDKNGKPEDNFTDDQYAALAELLLKLQPEYQKATVLGHRDLHGVKKDCPCFDVRAWAKETLDAPAVD